MVSPVTYPGANGARRASRLRSVPDDFDVGYQGAFRRSGTAWMIIGTLELFPVSMATSVTMEDAFDEMTLAVNCRAALRRAALFLVRFAAVVALLASQVLGPGTPAYAAHDAPVLELLLGVATLPKALIELYLGTLRAQSWTAPIGLGRFARGILLLGLAVALTGVTRITAAGVAVLASQALVALVIAPRPWHVLSAAQAVLTAACIRRWEL